MKFFTAITLLLLLSGTLIVLPVLSSSSNTITITSSGQILTPNVTAASGSASDIQAAVDFIIAHGGIGNVSIPEGTFNFVEVGEPWQTVTVPAGINILGAPTERDADGQVIEWKTVLVMPWDVPGDDTVGIPSWFRINGNGDPNTPSRFSDIKLVGYRSINPSSTSMHAAISVVSVIDFRIDHCSFEHTTAGVRVGTEYLGTPRFRGVIDHCKLINLYGSPTPFESRNIDYGVHVFLEWHENVWEPIEQVLGHYNDYTVFIEDCYFKKWRHCVCANNGGHFVFRYNTIEEDFGYGSLDVHEYRTETSGRAAEIYNNIFSDPEEDWGKYAIKWRGGGGVAFNNIVTGYKRLAYLVENAEVQEETYQPHDIWVWNNNLPGDCVDVSVDGDIQEGVHYWRNAPHTFNYIPYPYPHPLTLEE